MAADQGRLRTLLTGAAIGAAVVLTVIYLPKALDGAGRVLTDYGEAPASSGSGAMGESALEWTQVESTISWAEDYVLADGLLYVLSTAPGTNSFTWPPPKALYWTADGVEWESTPIPFPWISNIAAHDGLLYTVGTAPGAASREEMDLTVGVSADQGASWEFVDLDLLDTGAGLWPGSIGIEVSDEGFLLMVVGDVSRSWTGPSLDALNETSAPFGQWLNEGSLRVVGDRFVNVASGVRQLVDGTWEAVSTPVVGEAMGLGLVDDTYVLVMQGNFGPTVWTSPDIDGPWAELPLPDEVAGLQAWVSRSVISDHGVLLSLEIQTVSNGPFGGPIEEQPMQAQILETTDLESWALYNVGEIAGVPISWPVHLLPTPAGFSLAGDWWGGNRNVRTQLVATGS